MLPPLYVKSCGRLHFLNLFKEFCSLWIFSTFGLFIVGDTVLSDDTVDAATGADAQTVNSLITYA